MDPAILQAILDRAAIVETVVRYARALDQQDWDLCESCFTAEIAVDYSDFRGDPPSMLRVEEFVAARRSGLSGVKTLHVSANHDVTLGASTALCSSAFIIHRYRPNDQGDSFYSSYGYYLHTLTSVDGDWRICGAKQSVFFNVGNPLVHGANLANAAQAR